ncbi:hypothetical protein AC249_AIPGENE897, partial [Exaiptasia diaphana]
EFLNNGSDPLSAWLDSKVGDNILLHGYARHLERCERRFLSLHAQWLSRFNAKARLPFKMASGTMKETIVSFTDTLAILKGSRAFASKRDDR